MKKHIANAIVSLFLSACILSAAPNDFVFYQVPASGPLTKKLVTPGTSKLFGWGSSTSTPVAITIGSGLSLNTSTNTLTSSGGSGDVATDAIFDAAGDLIQGTGANTSARVALGTSGQLLRVKSDLTGVEWATISGTGSVTSVAVSGSDGIEIDSGSPITASGTIALGINASALRTHLGLVIGTNVQAYDADLTTYAGITPSANVQTLLGSADYAAFRASLSLSNVENTALSTWAGTTNITTLGTITTGTWTATAIGTGYLASGATLDTEWDTAAEINAATTDADFLTTTAAASAYQPLDTELTTLSSATAAGLALMDDADASAQRTTLGLGTLATQSATISDYLTTAAAASAYQPLDADLTTLAGGVPGLGGGVVTYSSGGGYVATLILPYTNGGTGISSFATGDLIYGGGTGVGLLKLSGNTTATKKFLTQTGSGISSAAPAWDTIAIGDITSLGTGVGTALAVNVGSAGAFVTFNGALGTPSSGTATNLTGTASGLTAGTVTTNANLTGDVTSSGSNATTLAAMTAPGPLLAENASIRLDPAGSADGKYSGTTVTGTAGATLAFGDLVVLDVNDSRWELADANSAAAADGDSRALLGVCVLAAAGDGSATTILLHGIVRADTAFPALTVGAPVYVGETAGDAVVTQPTTADVVIRILGHALTADELYFNPDNSWTTHL